jgi:hypothetical protein
MAWRLVKHRDNFTFTYMDLGKEGWEVVDWTNLAQERDQWRAFVNKVMNLRVS